MSPTSRAGGISGLLVIVSIGMIAVGVLLLARRAYFELGKLQQTIAEQAESGGQTGFAASVRAQAGAVAAATKALKSAMRGREVVNIALDVDRSGEQSYAAEGTVTVEDASGSEVEHMVLMSLFQADSLDSQSMEVAIVIIDNKPVSFNPEVLDKVTRDAKPEIAAPAVETTQTARSTPEKLPVEADPAEVHSDSLAMQPKMLTAEIANVRQQVAPLGGMNICFKLKNTSSEPISHIELRIKFTDYNRDVLADEQVRTRTPVLIQPGEVRECVVRAPSGSSLSAVMPDTVKGSAVVVFAQ